MHRVDENSQFRGQLVCWNLLPNAGCIRNVHVAGDAALAAPKLQHAHRATYAQESATAAADETRVVHIVHGAHGLLKALKAGCVDPCTGDAAITVDLLKNGASILDAAISLTSAQAAYALVAGTIDTEAVVAGDVLEIAVDGTIGTGALGKGVFAYVDEFEDAE